MLETLWAKETMVSWIVFFSCGKFRFLPRAQMTKQNSLLLRLLWLQLYWFTISIHLFSYNQNPLNLNNLAWLFKEVFFPRLCVLSVDKCVYICLSQILSMLSMVLEIFQVIRIIDAKPLMTVISLFSYFSLIGSHASWICLQGLSCNILSRGNVVKDFISWH